MNYKRIFIVFLFIGNDISMIRAAGVGVAMGNAGDDVKQAADFVIVGGGDEVEAAAGLDLGCYLLLLLLNLW